MTRDELDALLEQFAPDRNVGRLDRTEATETIEVEEPGPYTGRRARQGEAARHGLHVRRSRHRRRP